MNGFWIDILCCIAYIISGAVILACLRRTGFRIARNSFGVVYGILMLYVPFYLGGYVMIGMLCKKMTVAMSYYFTQEMREILAAPTPFFHCVSLGMLLLAIVVASATLIILAFLALEVVTVVKKMLAFYLRVKNDDSIRFVHNYKPYLAADNKIFLEFCCLLN